MTLGKSALSRILTQAASLKWDVLILPGQNALAYYNSLRVFIDKINLLRIDKDDRQMLNKPEEGGIKLYYLSSPNASSETNGQIRKRCAAKGVAFWSN